MKEKLIKLLRENSESINYEIEHIASYDGQDNYELGMYINGEIIGMVEYTLYDGELTVSNIVVRPEMRRKGYGSRMMAFLKREYPEYQYKPSMKTDLGSKFVHKDIQESLELPIMKNMEPAPYMGSRFGQDVEPAGTYVSHFEKGATADAPNYKYGKAVFNNPLVIDIDDDTIIKYKNQLSDKFKAKGKKLTQKLMAKGYDGLITRWPNGAYNEIVLFPNTTYMLS